MAYAQTSTVNDVLNFALTLEYLESEFYNSGLNAPGLLTSAQRTIVSQISKHEAAHVGFLKSVLGANAVPKPNFDFSAHGAYPDWNTNVNTYFTLAQAFEDTGVRAYKGQATNLMSNDTVLQAALQIHSVEARHASEIRRMRGDMLGQDIRGWIQGSNANGAPAPVYNGEQNTTQGGVDLSTVASLNGINPLSIAAAFDEPLDQNAVLAIATPFIA
jgi:rubrerythrin